MSHAYIKVLRRQIVANRKQSQCRVGVASAV